MSSEREERDFFRTFVCQEFCIKHHPAMYWGLLRCSKWSCCKGNLVQLSFCYGVLDMNWMSVHQRDSQIRWVQLGWSSTWIALVSSIVGSNFGFRYISHSCIFHFFHSEFFKLVVTFKPPIGVFPINLSNWFILLGSKFPTIVGFRKIFKTNNMNEEK